MFAKRKQQQKKFCFGELFVLIKIKVHLFLAFSFSSTNE